MLSAAPPGRGQGGVVLDGQPAHPAAPPAGQTDASRTYAPPTRLKVCRALVEAGRVVPLLLGVLLDLGVGVTLLALLVWSLWAPSSWPGRVIAAGWSRPWSPWRRSGPSSAGTDRGTPVVVLVRLAQRARRHVHRGPRRTVVRRAARARSRSTSGCGCSAPGSAAASGATPTGCPRPTWSTSTTAPPSTAAASCRPTCSTTGCSAWTRSRSRPVRPWDRTALSCPPRRSAGTPPWDRCRS